MYRNKLRMLQAVDEMLDGILRELEAKGELDNTYILYSTDNGYHLGQHGLVSGKRYWYYHDTNFQLIVRGSGVPAGKTSVKLVGNHDHAPTFAAITGATMPRADGRSLLPLFSDPAAPWRRYLLLERFADGMAPQPWTGVVTEDRKYVLANNGELLYDRTTDPYETRQASDPAALADLRARLKLLRDCAGAECRAAEDGSP